MKVEEIIFGVWIFIASILKTIFGIILLLPTISLICKGEWLAIDWGGYVMIGINSIEDIAIFLLLGVSALAGVYLIVNGGIKSYLTLTELYKNNASYISVKIKNYIELVTNIINHLKEKRNKKISSQTSSSLQENN